MMRICSDHTAEGTIWPVDAALRPEGRSGPLVRTVASHQGYYERWAKTWEFQALLKARPVAGDAALGREYCERIGPMVWSAAEREGFVTDVQAMRRRVLEHIPAQHAERQLKLGSGGLRDVEFAVQLLQLVHGRGDEKVRCPATLSALAELTRGGYVGREDGASLDAAYKFLRTLEHRIQLAQLRRTHVVPDDEESLRRLGRSMGCRRQPIAELDQQWKQHRREVRRLHEKLFYRPLLAAVAKLPGDEARLTPEAAKQRLAALGYADPVGALRHLEALTSGVSRSAAIQRTLLPVMLEWFADAPDPDAGLLGFRKISEALGSTHWYLRLLRDEGQVAYRMALVLASSRYGTDLLQRAPEGVALLGKENGLVPLSREALEKEMVEVGLRQTDPVQAIEAVRAIRRRELFRVATADLVGELDVAAVGLALTDITVATLEAALAVASAAIEAERRAPLPTRIAIVAMGRFGGHELSYGSDADVMFVHEPLEGVDGHEASTAATHVANELRRLLALPGTDPALDIDTGLRPRASRARWSARWTPTRPTTPSGPRSGRPRRCCGPTRSSATAACATGSPRWPTRCASRPTGSPTRTSGRYGGSRHASTPSGCRAAPTRPPTSSSAAAAWPTWSGPSSCSRCSTPGRSSRCAPPARWTRWPPRSRRTCCRRRTPTRCGRPGRRRAGCATRSCSCADGRRTRCRATRGEGGRGAPVRLRAGGVRRAGERLPADHPPGPGRGRPGLLGLTERPTTRASPRPVSRTRRRDVGADLGGGNLPQGRSHPAVPSTRSTGSTIGKPDPRGSEILRSGPQELPGAPQDVGHHGRPDPPSGGQTGAPFRGRGPLSVSRAGARRVRRRSAPAPPRRHPA